MSDLELGRLLLSLVTLLVVALAFGRAFERLGMPNVIGEIIGGLALGPTLLGYVSPDLYAWMFRGFSAQAAVLSGFYWIGLILLMFVAGFNVQRELTGADRKTVAVMLISSTIFPMLGGWYLPALLDASRMMNADASPISFHLVLAIGTAVTSIPFVSRIFIDLGLMTTRFAKVVLMTATLQDLLLWTALAVATALNSSKNFDLTHIGVVIVTTLIFIGLAIAFGPATLLWVGRRLPIHRSPSSYVGYALIVCFALAALASFLNVNVVFGALVAGVIIGSLPNLPLSDVRQRISDVALWFFVPLYFAMVGAKLDLIHQLDLRMALIFLLASSALKMLSVGLALRFTGTSGAMALNFGVAMNTRGGPGIVLASVAFEFGIITESFFITLILASILTSLFTGAWLKLMLRRGQVF